MATSYLLTAQNITATTVEILVTEDVSPFNPASGVTVSLTSSGTGAQGTTDTNGIATFTGLSSLTTYTASVTNSPSITFITLDGAASKTATLLQWQDLVAKVKAKSDVQITMTTTDPGEGSALAANNFVGVYNA